MSKKKRQDDPNENSDESTDSCDENQNVVECPHIYKSVDLQRVRKALAKTGYAKECEQCKKSNENVQDEVGSDYEFDLSLWMCLKCGFQACGRGKNRHALKHFETPRSDCHAMCVNTTMWNVWCYECDEDVNVTSKKRLMETVRHLKKMWEQGQGKPEIQDEVSIDEKVMDVVIEKRNNEVTNSSVSLQRVRGLANLGNTCFFNSVMQCLGQTPYLVDLLEETSHAGCAFSLPGGKLTIDKTVVDLPPLEGTIDEWRPLNRILCDTLKELQSGHRETYVPRMLHSTLTMRLPQFGGGDQHDSHELLRHLLDAVLEEDLRRYQAVILEKFGLKKSSNPSTVEEEKRKVIKFYGQQASEQLLPTEQVFRGELVSTLQCQECRYTSHRNEFFLDLSLPILEAKNPPGLRRKIDELDENKPSQFQLKKEKRQAKKLKKLQKNNQKNHQGGGQNSGSKQTNSESESDADVEDNVELKRSPVVPEDGGNPKGAESGYNSDKAENGSPERMNHASSPDMCVDDSGVPSPAVGTLCLSPVVPDSPEHSRASSDTNVDMGSPVCGRNSPNDVATLDFERPESRLSFADSKLPVDLSKLSLLNDGDSKKVDLLSSRHGACGGFEKMEEEAQEPEELWTSTISERYQCEEGECSILSCLNQFTACELMTGNNKVGCDRCTEHFGGPDKKIVYRNVTKQLLIYNPPAVLILHLKRFQVCRFRSMKVSRHVTFHTLLDLAPFVSKRSQNLPTIEPDQTNILYSLYGVVEHSGSIHGGHYVAYVKVRPPLEENSYRWQFLPKYQAGGRRGLTGAQAKTEEPTGRWFYVSDSHVSEVAEARVLEAQAYLLFYERIL